MSRNIRYIFCIALMAMMLFPVMTLTGCVLIEVGDNAVTIEEACNAAEYAAVAIRNVLVRLGMA